MVVTNATKLRAEYDNQGFVVVRDVVPTDLIDAVLYHYREEILPTDYRLYRQNTNRYEKNRTSPAGHVLQSFLDIHDYQKFPKFSHAVREIVCHPDLHSVLQEITGAAFCNVMQTMLFDANTTTPPHQDWWYLDTVPNGHLLGTWIALEDIAAAAGRFFVIPQSTDVALHTDPDLPHSEWMKRIREYYETHEVQVEAPTLRKGDVLFWNSRTVHGSLPTIDPRFSRKSITAHFLPDGYAFGNLFVQKDFVKYKQHNGINFYRNQPDYSWSNAMKSRFKQSVYDSPLLMKAVRQVQKLVVR